MLSRLKRFIQDQPNSTDAPNSQDQIEAEEQVKDLERRINQLRLAAEVARDVAELRPVNEMLDRVVNLVHDRFGFYHAGIFMIADDREYAVLKSASGEIGQEILKAGHRLKVGSEGMVGQVASSGELHVANDVKTDEYHWVNPYLPETRAELSLPLKVGTKIIGILDVQCLHENAFRETDIRNLQALADQLAVAIENARLFEATQRQLKGLSVLHSVATACTDSTDEDELIERVTQIVAETLYPDNFGVLLLDTSVQELQYHPSYREREGLTHQPVPLGSGIVGLVARCGQPVRVSNAREHPNYLEVDPETRSEICVPIRKGEHTFGVINAESTQPDHFSAQDEQLLLTVANQLATGLENLRLLSTTRRRASELEVLRQASLQLTSSLDLQLVLKTILEHAIRLLNAEAAHIFLYNGKKLTFGTAIWASGQERQPFDNPSPQGLSYTVARTGKVIPVSDTLTHPLFVGRSWNGAVIGLPLREGGNVIGVMNLSFSGGPRKFDEHEVHILELLADQAAIAMTNARNYSAVQEHAHELTEALAQKNELVRLKNEFIQNVSHELRTPLAIARGYIELLQQGELGELNHEQREALTVINRRNKFLIRLVDDLVAILEAEVLDLTNETINLTELVNGLISDFQPASVQARIRLKVDLTATPLYILGSTPHLTRLIDNLVNNALKFTLADGTVTISLREADGQAVLQVKDTGIGIPADKLDKIFDRFYQVNGSAKRRFGGTGLGLSLVRDITLAHKGKVSVDSQVGRGSTFTVSLPLLTIKS